MAKKGQTPQRAAQQKQAPKRKREEVEEDSEQVEEEKVVVKTPSKVATPAKAATKTPTKQQQQPAKTPTKTPTKPTQPKEESSSDEEEENGDESVLNTTTTSVASATSAVSDVSEVSTTSEPEEKASEEKPEGWLTTTSFDSLEINENLKKALKQLKYSNLTEIQSKSIQPLLAGKDLLGQAKTGSGKTLAFLIPIIELLYRAEFKARNGTGAIILAPTRELAIQIYQVAKELMQYHTQTHCIVMGGANKDYEAKKLQKGANLVVATPGRLLDHLMHTTFNFKNLIALVIDEADRILEVGFEEAMRAIVKLLPKKNRQTLLFSATQTTKVSDLARLSLNGDPVCVGVSSDDDDLDTDKPKIATADKLEQGYVLCPAEKKFTLLYSFLKRNKNKKIIVFFSTCNSVKYHAELLNYINIPVLDLHGKLKQNKRTNTFFNFCNAKEGTLLCTDVAARGLDIPAVDWIIQYDPPENPKEYIHRVGRTARAGKQGKALLLLLPTEKGFLKYLKHAGVPLNELSYPEKQLANIQSKLEAIVATNYYLYKTATEAFQSYIRSYAAHTLKDIFPFKDLDVKGVTKAFGLQTTPYVDLNSIEVAVGKKMKEKQQKSQKWMKGSGDESGEPKAKKQRTSE